MRNATSDVAHVRDGQNIYVSLGYDFVSEHEQGISGMEAAFGFGDSSIIGLDRYKTTRADDTNVLLYKKSAGDGASKREFTVLMGGLGVDRYRDDKLNYWREPVISQWDSRTFRFALPTEDAQVLRDLHDAFLNNDIAIFRHASGLMGGTSLCIARYSTIPQAVRDQIAEKHLDRNRLLDAADATGIRKRVDAANRKYFALSPAWVSDDSKSKHPVMFWLNPYDQQNNNYGWFTVEELDSWTKGTGPIPK